MIPSSQRNSQRAPRLHSGVLVCVVIGLFASLVMAAFFVASRTMNRDRSNGVAYGIPSRPLRVAVYDLTGEKVEATAAPDRFRAGEPDTLFLRGASGRDLGTIATAWAAGRFTPSQAYYPSQNLWGTGNSLGVAILSRYPLHDARPIPNHMSGAFGVWAVCDVDGKRFYVASVRFSDDAHSGDRAAEFNHLLTAWQALKSPPLIAGGFIGSSTVTEPFRTIELPQGQSTLITSSDWRRNNREGAPLEPCIELVPEPR